MNQQDLINAIAAETGLAKTDILSVIKVQGDVVQAELSEGAGGEVVLHGIGKLVTVAKPERTARNPGTGEEVTVPAHNAVKFRAAKALKDEVA